MVNIDLVKSIAILGDGNTAKTNLAVYLIRDYVTKGGKKKVYLVGYPKKIDNFESISSFTDIFKIRDAIIFIDELQRYIKIYDRKANYELMELISFFYHNNNTLIFTTSLTQFVTKGIEAVIDCWMLTRIMDIGSLKNGSKAKRIIQVTTHPKCTCWSLALENGEYLEYCENNKIGENGVKRFPDQKIAKDWSIQ